MGGRCCYKGRAAVLPREGGAAKTKLHAVRLSLFGSSIWKLWPASVLQSGREVLLGATDVGARRRRTPRRSSRGCGSWRTPRRSSSVMQRSNPLGKRAGGWVEFYHRGDEARRRQCGSTHVGTGKVTSASLPSNRCLIGRLPRRGIARFDPPGDAQRYPKNK
jgi:hypothetical protein